MKRFKRQKIKRHIEKIDKQLIRELKKTGHINIALAKAHNKVERRSKGHKRGAVYKLHH